MTRRELAAPPSHELSGSHNSPHLRLAASSPAQVEFSLEALMLAQTLCAQCDLPEDRCSCERYCTICKGQLNVRLCSDGHYYFRVCGAGCDAALHSSRVHCTQNSLPA